MPSLSRLSESDTNQALWHRPLVAPLSAWLCALLTVALVFAAGPGEAGPPSTLDYTLGLDQGLLGQGRQAYRERADHTRARDAYRILKLNYEQNPEDAVAAWHFSLSCYFMGKRVLKDPESRTLVYVEGRAAADAGLLRDAECGPCHLMTAINSALWANEVGIFRVIVGLPKVKWHLQRAAEIDPRFGGAAPFRIQSMIARALPRIFGGGMSKAREFIEQAIRVDPNEALNYEILSLMLLHEYDDARAAVAVARLGLSRPSPGPEYIESHDAIVVLEQIVDVLGKTGSPSGG
jgi:hypothetical protein